MCAPNNSNNEPPESMWICPSCHTPLQLENNTWRCDAKHTFDRAKQGYVNLLLAQHKSSKEPGDSKEMIVARREFLQQGYYQPLADKLAYLIAQQISADRIHVFDAGCGEGYYVNQIHQRLTQRGQKVVSAGCDIAKIAVQMAAKSYKDSQFAVASSYDLPLPDNSQDVLIQVFAPALVDEIVRVLKPGGIWLRVNPAPDHLFALKSCLYQQPKQHTLDQIEHPELLSKERLELNSELNLNNPQSRLSLLKMTPFYWSASTDAQTKFIEDNKPCYASFDILLMEKRSL